MPLLLKEFTSGPSGDQNDVLGMEERGDRKAQDKQGP